MIEARNLVKKYGEQTVIEDLSIELTEGKIIAFIGPNGAGKSTLLGLISRLIEADGGEVLIDGVNLKDWNSNELAKKLSILKQSNHLNMRLKVRDLVSFGRFPYSQGRLTDEDWEFIDKAIAYMNLEPIQHKFIDELSGGQRQRAMIAMVIAQNTDYILLDEPLNNLDMKYSIEMMKVLRNLVKDFNKTILIVVHDLNIASIYSDEIVAMKDGRVVSIGEVNEIISKDLLESLYEIEFHIENVDERRFCIFY